MLELVLALLVAIVMGVAIAGLALGIQNKGKMGQPGQSGEPGKPGTSGQIVLSSNTQSWALDLGLTSETLWQFTAPNATHILTPDQMLPGKVVQLQINDDSLPNNVGSNTELVFGLLSGPTFFDISLPSDHELVRALTCTLTFGVGMVNVNTWAIFDGDFGPMISNQQVIMDTSVPQPLVLNAQIHNIQQGFIWNVILTAMSG